MQANKEYVIEFPHCLAIGENLGIENTQAIKLEISHTYILEKQKHIVSIILTQNHKHLNLIKFYFTMRFLPIFYFNLDIFSDIFTSPLCVFLQRSVVTMPLSIIFVKSFHKLNGIYRPRERKTTESRRNPLKQKLKLYQIYQLIGEILGASSKTAVAHSYYIYLYGSTREIYTFIHF